MLTDQANRLRDIPEFSSTIGAQTGNVGRTANRLFDPGSLARREVEGQPHDFEGKKQVGKDNGGVDTEDFGGGNGDLGRKFGFLADLNQGMLLANRAIFRHVAAGLTHKPDRRTLDRLGLASTHEERLRGGHKPSNLAFRVTGECEPGHRQARFCLAQGGIERARAIEAVGVSGRCNQRSLVCPNLRRPRCFTTSSTS